MVADANQVTLFWFGGFFAFFLLFFFFLSFSFGLAFVVVFEVLKKMKKRADANVERDFFILRGNPGLVLPPHGTTVK